MNEKRVADYFIISGVSEKVEQNTESKPLINSVLPITDITVIFKSLGEQCPIGYTCIEYTPGGHIADLNNGNFKSPNIHICYKRGSDKPPLVEVGVYHQDRDRVLPDVEVIYETPYGRSASTGNTSPKCGTFITYRRAKTKSPYSQLVVVDLCVILNNKSEHPPHAFYSIRKNLNKSYYGMIGSEVFLCYKKTLLSPPSICYQPQIISRFPLQDLANFPLPDTVPLFCLPAGASIELRPSDSPLPKPIASTFVLTSDSAQKIYGSSLSFYEPYDSNLLSAEQKARLNICDAGDDSNKQQTAENGGGHVSDHYETYAIKSICILSRWPFFDCFEKFLNFLHKLVFPPGMSAPNSPVNNIYYNKGNIPLEHHISHFLLDVSFPTSQRPTVMVQLMPGTDETLTISQPSSQLPLPLTGASFIHLLATLGVENTMNVLLFGLCEQKILLHSLNPWLLTTVAEAITAMLFPFHWQCPYVPLCPLSLYGILNAPLPFIVGIDSRCFDTFTPPEDVICVDLDTRSIFLSELKKCLNVRILPKRASRVLRNSLDEILQKWIRVSQALGANQSPQHRTAAMEASRQQLKRKFELEIQEAFVRFMATILRGFRSYLLPITKAPTVGATDPTSLFDFEGFLMSRERSHGQFYQLITKTQLFTHYIEERSFVSDKDTSLAFFDDCEERLTAAEDSLMNKPIKLFEKYDELIETDRSVYIPAPEQSPPVSHNNSVTFDESPVTTRGQSFKNNLRQQNPLKFGPLDAALFHRHPPANSNFPPLDKAFKLNQNAKSQSSILDDNTKAPNNSFSIARRTKQEVEASRRTARKSARGPQEWSRYLVSCCYCLWFSLLPSYISYCKDLTEKSSDEEEEENSKLIIEVSQTNGDEQPSVEEVKSESEKTTARILRHAYSATVRMQRLQLTTDEVCFRILTLLCGHYGHPALAVRVFFEMRKAGIKPNAITYGYYNTALLESRWPDHSGKPTTVLWTKIRNVIMGIALFKFHGRVRMGRRDRCSVPLLGGHDMSFGHRNLNVIVPKHSNASTPAAASRDELFVRPTTMPISKELLDDDNDRLLSHEASSHRGFNQHRRSLVNRAFSNYQKSALDVANPNESGMIEYEDNANYTDAGPTTAATAAAVQHTRRGGIRKSHSMHARSGSAQARGLLSRSSSYDEDDDDDDDDDDDERLIETVAVPKSKANESLVFLTSEYTRKGLPSEQQQDDSFLVETQQEHDAQTVCETKTLNLICQVATSPTKNKFNRPNLNNSADFLQAGVDDASGSEETRSNRLSESITDDPSTGNPSNDIEFNSMDAISTPNFKLSSLINDASNLQWSKWTSSQNSKSVYKNIKSVATGLVSSLQEIKSSFSMSESATPSKLMSTVQHKSTNTREMLSQWATQWGYFLSQTSGSLEGGDGGGELNSDDESVTSDDLLNLVDDDNFEQSSVETNDFQVHHRQLIESERAFNLSSCKNDFLNHLYELPTCETTSDKKEVEDRVAISIKLTTCFRCNACQSMLNDDEIMGRWSCNESNLNTKCVYCRAKIVPMMTVQIEDRRFISQVEADEKEKVTELTNNLVDMNFDECDRAMEREDQQQQHLKHKQLEENLVDLEEPEKVSEKNERHQTDLKPGDKSKPNWINFSFMVPYLSPIVLRKELESVFESAGDSCPASCRFIDEHPIIFWNLLWYFSRIGVPTHLAYLCLESKSILNGRTLPTSATGQLASRDKVVVNILWDTE